MFKDDGVLPADLFGEWDFFYVVVQYRLTQRQAFAPKGCPA